MQEGPQTVSGLEVEENTSAPMVNILKRTEKLSNLKMTWLFEHKLAQKLVINF